LYSAEICTLQKIYEKYLEIFGMWRWIKMEKISWTNRLNNCYIVNRGKNTDKGWLTRLVTPFVATDFVNMLLTEINKERRGIRRTQLLDNLIKGNEKKCELKRGISRSHSMNSSLLLRLDLSHDLLSYQQITRWFKYDRDDLCVNKSQFVPVIFEPPCTLRECSYGISTHYQRSTILWVSSCCYSHKNPSLHWSLS
jgi:hypothetical protein